MSGQPLGAAAHKGVRMCRAATELILDGCIHGAHSLPSRVAPSRRSEVPFWGRHRDQSLLWAQRRGPAHQDGVLNDGHDGLRKLVRVAKADLGGGQGG